MHKLIFIFTLILFSSNSHAVNMIGRTGLGFSSQYAGDLTALSFKVQQTRDVAYGALVAIKSDEDNVDYGLGAKVYKLIFDEPHLNFFASGLFGVLRTNDESGFQVDGTMGSEFHLPGIESIGFSFEFGFSINRLNSSTNIETVGYNFISAAVHFYL